MNDTCLYGKVLSRYIVPSRNYDILLVRENQDYVYNKSADRATSSALKFDKM